MKLSKKIILSVVAILLVAVISYAAYYVVHYWAYDDYKQYIRKTEYEPGTEFKAINDSTKAVEGMVLVTENENFMLYLKKEDASMAIYDKRNHTTTYSNPQNIDEDTIVNPGNRALLESQLIIDIISVSRQKATYNSKEYAINYNQFSFESIENGFRTVYLFGKTDSPTGIVPTGISNERMEWVFGNLTKALDEKEATTIIKYIKNRYILNKKTDVYEITAGAKGGSVLRKLKEYFATAGYTEEDYVKDMEETKQEYEIPATISVTLEYRLTDEGLKVVCPTSQIKETGGININKVTILPFFGAAFNTEDGNLIVPNGSGSIIHFNNGKTTSSMYQQFIYGNDPLQESYEQAELSEKARLPIFGIQKEEYGIFAVIEDGAPLASLTAGVSGNIHQYNYANFTFVVRGTDTLAMFGVTGNESSLPLSEKKIYDCNITINYALLEKEESDYSGMANYYRNKLIDEGKLALLTEAKDIPFYMDVIGGVKRSANFVGVQYLQVFPMTTFEQAKDMVTQFSEANVNNVVMNYQGWMNGGYYHDVVDKLKLVKKLGSKKDISSLKEMLESNGGKLYGDVAFQEITYISKRYQETKETSRYFAGGYTATFGQLSPITTRKTASLGYRETLYNLISPKFLVRYVDKFANKITDYDFTGIGLRDLGSSLQSDKKRTEVISRLEAEDIVLGQFEKLNELGMDMLISQPNAYALKYADDIINLPTAHNSYYVIDEYIPFYEMLVHGCIDYAGATANLDSAYDPEKTVVEMVEAGCAPHFVFTYESASEMKYTGLNRFYATTFDTWKQDAIDIYQKVNEALKPVSNATIKKHELLSKDFTKITYSNDVVIYVNKSDVKKVDGAITLEPNSYYVEGVK